MSEFYEIPLNEKTWVQRLAIDAKGTCIKENRPFLTGIEHTDETAYLMRPSCKMWNCPACSARNAKRWIARIINHMNTTDAENGWQMFTLTAHRNARTEFKSVLNLRNGWKKLYNRMRYEFGISEFVKVWERHKSDAMHLHGIVNNGAIVKKWLKNNAAECGMGYQVDIHPIDNAGQVAGYIAKYFMKSELVDASDFPKGLRRIEVSRNWTKLPDLIAERDFTWIINQTREGQLRNAQWYKAHDFKIVDLVKDPEKL